MTEPTASLGYDDLASAVGFYLGFGRTSGNWTSEQTSHIDEIIQSGLRRFYFPTRTDAQSRAHEWSFLRPTTTIVIWPTVTGTVSGTPTYSSPSSTITATADKFYPSMVGKSFTFDTSGNSYTIAGYTSATVITVTGDASSEASGDTFTITSNSNFRLPDDFGALDSKLVYPTTQTYPPIKLVSDTEILASRNGGGSSYAPYMCAVRPLDLSAGSGQRWEIMFYPDVDAIYTLTYRYTVLMDKLTTGNYPYGGLVHGETILQSCLAVAEERSDDIQGIHAAEYTRRLIASIEQDSRGTIPEYFGYNGDFSEGSDRMDYREGFYYRTTPVTYKGTLYGAD